jgi:D-glycero-alpha-D-manno-heptose-7-phosphate kinase
MLIVSRTPLRISFFGGGTDYPEYFERGRGAVVGMAIDKYLYIAALRLSSILDYRYRVSYSRIETRADADAIEHPVVRSVIRHFGVTDPLDLSIMADLPARSGLGSSSSFTVGLVNLICALQRRQITKLDLARTAQFVERELLAENVGVQDQYHASFGGLNRFDFEGNRARISPVQMTGPCLAALTGSLLLVYTGRGPGSFAPPGADRSGGRHARGRRSGAHARRFWRHAARGVGNEEAFVIDGQQPRDRSALR